MDAIKVFATLVVLYRVDAGFTLLKGQRRKSELSTYLLFSIRKIPKYYQELAHLMDLSDSLPIDATEWSAALKKFNAAVASRDRTLQNIAIIAYALAFTFFEPLSPKYSYILGSRLYELGMPEAMVSSLLKGLRSSNRESRFLAIDDIKNYIKSHVSFRSIKEVSYEIPFENTSNDLSHCRR